MTQRHHAIALVSTLFALLALTACEDENAKKKAKKSNATAQATPEKEVLLGIKNQDNDPILIGLVRGALDSCRWHEKTGIDRNCAQYKSFATKKAAAGKAATLTRLLQDEDPHVRWLGADGLMTRATGHRTDPALTRIILSSAALESDPHVIKRLAVVLNNLDTDATRTRDELLALMETHPQRAMRLELAKLYLQLHPDAVAAAATEKLARKDADAGVRVVALGALVDTRPLIDKPALCTLVSDLIGSDDHPKLSEIASYHALHLHTDGGCPDTWDPALTLLETRAAQGKLTSATAGQAFKGLLDQPAAASLLPRAIAAARTTTSNRSNQELARSNALGFLGKADPDARKFARAFKEKDHPFVMAQAAKILGAKKK